MARGTYIYMFRYDGRSEKYVVFEEEKCDPNASSSESNYQGESCMHACKYLV